MDVDNPEIEGIGFATLRFEGARFDGANLPLDFLDNIAAYQRLIRELAVEIWREKNPERARLPRQFRQHISLSFGTLTNGSAKAAVRRDPFFQSTLPFEHEVDYLALAQARFMKEVQAANNNEPIGPLPHKAKGDLRLLVSDLSGTERLSISSFVPGVRDRQEVRYTSDTASRLLDAVRVPETKEISGLAIVSGIDDTAERVKLTTKFGVFYYPLERDHLRREFTESLNKVTAFSATVRTTVSGSIAQVVEAKSIRLLPERDERSRLLSRVESLSHLLDGWQDGAGLSIKKKTLHSARDIGSYISTSYNKIAAFPMRSGGICFEFSCENIEVILSVGEEVILLEAFDDSDADMKSQAFFAVTPTLLSHLDDLKGFVK